MGLISLDTNSSPSQDQGRMVEEKKSNKKEEPHYMLMKCRFSTPKPKPSESSCRQFQTQLTMSGRPAFRTVKQPWLPTELQEGAEHAQESIKPSLVSFAPK